MVDPVWRVFATLRAVQGWYKTKKPSLITATAFYNNYGSYLLSRILVQYHRP
jgi:hypothetical protein